MALRRYSFVGLDNTELAKLIGTAAAFSAGGNQPVIDFDIPIGLETDADNILATRGFALLSATPVGTPEDAANGLLNASVWGRAVDVWADVSVALTGLIVVDGITTTVGMRVLCSGQTTTVQDGVYIASAGAWSRAEDTLVGRAMASISYYVTRGTEHNQKQVRCTNLSGADIVGTHNLVFVAATGSRFTGGGLGNLKFEDNTVSNGIPTTPAEGAGILLYNRVRLNDRALNILSAQNRSYEVQGLLGDKAIELIRPVSGTTLFTAAGVATTNTTGTLTARALALTNLSTQLKRVGLATAATAAASASIRSNQASYLLNAGTSPAHGFKYKSRFVIAAVNATVRWFVGFLTAPALIANVNPSTLVNMVGYGCDSGQTTVRLFQCGAANPANFAATDQGVAYPSNVAGTVYEVTISATPQTGRISVSLLNMNTNAIQQDLITTNFPAAQFVAWHYWINNGTTASAVALDLVSHYLETDA